MQDYARQKLLRTTVQNDLSTLTWDSLGTNAQEGKRLLDMNSTFRYGIATESDIGLPPGKRVLVPVIVDRIDDNIVQQMYSDNVVMVNRFTLKVGGRAVAASRAMATRRYIAVSDVAEKAALDPKSKGGKMDDNNAFDQSSGVDPEDLAWLTLVCIRMNYLQLKADYPNLPDHVIIAGAHVIGMSYRNGLLESHAGRDFLFVAVRKDQQEDAIIQYIDPVYASHVNRVIAVDQVIASRDLKVNPTLMEIALGVAIGTACTHYTMNHSTGGKVLTGQNARQLAVNGLYTARPELNAPSETEQTNFYYNVLHPVNKRAVACLVIKNSHVLTWYRNAYLPVPAALYADSFMQYRQRLTPAGCHKVYVAMLALKAICEAKLSVFLPDLTLARKLMQLYDDILAAGARGHIGSMYYTDEPQSISQGEVDEFLPTAAFFVTERMAGSSLSFSPHMSVQHAAAAPDQWKTIVMQTKRIGASQAAPEAIGAYLKRAGIEGFTVDLTTEQGMDSAMEQNNAMLSELQIIFHGRGEARPSSGVVDH